jgi:hypothetical protein
VARFARVVFGLLVAATFSAFFVAHELKSRPPVIEIKRLSERFSPNGDGRRDVNRVSLVVREDDEVTIGIVDDDGDLVRRLADNVAAARYRPVRVEWDGRTDSGRRAPDGIYRLRVGLRRQGRSVVVQRAITLDTTPPRPLVRLVDEEQSIISPRGGPIPVRVRGTGRRAPRLGVWRTDVQPPRRVARLRGTRSGRAQWDPTPDGGAATPGVYLIEASVRDSAGNLGSSAPDLPALPGEVRGRPGVTIRALAAQPPLIPQPAREPVKVLVDSRQRPYRWSTRRLGRSRPGREGSSATGEPRLTFPAPGGASGVHLLELRSGPHRTRVPLLVRSPQDPKLLVVLPAISWLGRDRVDDDGDGLPDTLEGRGPVRWPRPFSGERGLPAGFADRVAPLLVSLDRAGVSYDVTTDLALSRGAGPQLAGHEGVVLAGSLRWIERPLALRLRRYVLRGGRMASYGVESMRRGVTVTDDRLERPTQPSRRDPLGTVLEPVRRMTAAEAPAVLEPLEEQRGLGLLEGSDGVLEGFTMVEESRRPSGLRARLLTALGQPLSDEETEGDGRGAPIREPLPVLAATRLGDGLFIRVGLPQWGRRLVVDDEVRQINSNIIDLLRGVRPRVRARG